MAKEVVWTKRAEKQFDATIKYLESEWSDRVVKAFVQRTESIVKVLAKYPELGSMEVPSQGIRGVKLSKHNLLFYRCDNQRLILLAIFDTRQNPKRKLS